MQKTAFSMINVGYKFSTFAKLSEPVDGFSMVVAFWSSEFDETGLLFLDLDTLESGNDVP
jgi:hypothetical protein